MPAGAVQHADSSGKENATTLHDVVNHYDTLLHLALSD
jgi:hypothetical protein